MLIASPPDRFRFLGKVGALGPAWMRSAAKDLSAATNTWHRDVTLDLSQVSFATMFEWASTVAILETILSNPQVSTVSIDLIGSGTAKLMPALEYIEALGGQRPNLDYTHEDFLLSDRVYLIAGFLESLGTRRVLNNRPNRVSSLFYPGIKATEVDLRNFYTKRQDGQTVVLGLTRVDTKEDCRQFLNQHRILSWRTAMSRRFQESPIFESEEIWRVLCHELAVNILEHARMPGFIAARVVASPFKDGKLKPWCKATYGWALGDLIHSMKEGFVELCVVDAGTGFVNTLKHTYLNRVGKSDSHVSASDILCFAFDEFGTCKESDESWATERHALGRVLQLVSKYGGALTVRSGGSEVLFRSTEGRFERIANHLGYVPYHARSFPNFPGAQLQLILPLVPRETLRVAKEARSVLSVSLPESFRIQPNQVRGHLVPLFEELDQTQASVGRDEQKRFRRTCEQLSRKLLRRPRPEPLVLDFSGLNWAPGQFETLLHLLQNVLQNRPVLLVEIDPQLAREVDELERLASPTQLDPAILVPDSSSNSFFDEISETIFLETFSRIHSPVLGLDEDGRRYLFGIMDSKYKQPLLTLIDTEASIEELALGSFSGEPLKQGMLRVILNRTNCLFEPVTTVGEKVLWRSVWDHRTLANEASRAISRHFDQVAESNNAWRGKSSD